MYIHRTKIFKVCAQFYIFNAHILLKNEHNSIYSTYKFFLMIVYNFVYSTCKIFQKMYTIMYIQCIQCFDVWIFFYANYLECKVCKFNIKTFKDCIQFYIFNVHNFLKNLHNHVYPMYTSFQKCNSSIYFSV